MKTRLITAGVGIVLCLVLLTIGTYYPFVLSIAISIVSAILCGELLTAKSLHKKYLVSVPCIVLAFLMPLFCIYEASLIPLYLFVVIYFILIVLNHNKFTVDEIFFALAGTILISLSMTALSAVANNEFGHYAFWVVLSLGVPWFADSGAYFSGVLLGKHKLCPAISPKKTVEGAVGGIICGVLSTFLIAYVFCLIYGADMSVGGGGTVRYGFEILPLIIIGVVNSVLSIFGDLTFSVIKRTCGIKDYGSIMPGHGGLLDRFDSVLFCSPLVYFISQYTEILYII